MRAAAAGAARAAAHAAAALQAAAQRDDMHVDALGRKVERGGRAGGVAVAARAAAELKGEDVAVAAEQLPPPISRALRGAPTTATLYPVSVTSLRALAPVRQLHHHVGALAGRGGRVGARVFDAAERARLGGGTENYLTKLVRT